jgi:hypothetical protein
MAVAARAGHLRLGQRLDPGLRAGSGLDDAFRHSGIPALAPP